LSEQPSSHQPSLSMPDAIPSIAAPVSDERPSFLSPMLDVYWPALAPGILFLAAALIFMTTRQELPESLMASGYGWAFTILYALTGLPVLFFTMFFGPKYIEYLKSRYMGQYIREDGPQSHLSKAGTPTSGGVVILAGFCVGLFLVMIVLGQWKLVPFKPQVLACLSTVPLIGFGLALLGFQDDFLKVTKKHNKGLSGYAKLAIQVGLGLTAGVILMMNGHATLIHLPGNVNIQLGWFYPVWVTLVVTGASNAVNLTDGLDGLASGTSIVSLFLMALFFPLIIPTMMPVEMGEALGLYSWVLMMATLGFMNDNRFPAKVFMGDCGSLALGGLIAILSILGHLEVGLLLWGGVFVIETLSVMAQVLSFKLTGKRILKMAPIHHHFELLGWHETKVVKTFILLQLLLGGLGVFLYNR
jgi:phospho-N-acetylmuramoyl-pentapeptide-transferase